MSIEIRAVYEGNQRCRASHGPSGTELSTDAPLDNGGKGESFSPTDLVATALGNCVLTIIAQVCERHDRDVRGMRVQVTKEMTAQPGRRIAALPTIVTIAASAVPDQADRVRLERAAKLCPVHRSLHPDIDAPISFEYVD